MAARGDRRPQIDRRGADPRTRPGDPNGAIDDLLDLGPVEPSAAGEPPGAIHQDANAKTLAGIVGHGGQLAVLDDDVLLYVFVETDVGVAGALHLGRVERGL